MDGDCFAQNARNDTPLIPNPLSPILFFYPCFARKPSTALLNSAGASQELA